MKARNVGTMVFLTLSLAATAASQQATNAGAAFDRLKGLSGTWRITDNRDNRDAQSQRVATFRSGAGNILILDEGGQLTVFHLDKDKLALTHYCGSGNQPRMRVQAIEDRKIVFAMYDI